MSAIEPATREFNRAVIAAFGLVRSFWLIEAGPRAVMIACRQAQPRSAAERAALEHLHTLANRLAPLEPPALFGRR
jgi:hypothetical protein